MEEVFEMSRKELTRFKILSQVQEGKLTQVLAAKQLNISERHIRRLLTQFINQKEKSIISKKRGKSSNRCLSKDLKSNVLSLVNIHYQDFGPKLANEYLQQQHNINISTETLRLWMIESHLWVSRSKNKKLHPPRNRRRCFGELIQIDGSHHDWFEGRSPPCVLMVFIDDATSAITSMYFSQTESLEAYYHTLEKHIKIYGIPLSIYADRCSVMVPRVPKSNKDSTQFKKALDELNCDLILALSPQAKGKVERANRTLQDRLIKNMRIKNISTIEEANFYIEKFRQEYNEKFSKKPSEHYDAHRSLDGICLENVLCIRETRTLSKDFLLQFESTFYAITPQDKKTHLFKGCKVEVRKLISGKIIAQVENEIVNITPLEEIETPLLDEKQFLEWKPKNKFIPSKNHPYKRQYKEKMLLNVV
jgi:hypothetical protein